MSAQKVDVLAWIDQATTGLHCLSKDSPAALKGMEVKRAVADLLAALIWYVENDDTKEGDDPIPMYNGNTWNELNGEWIAGKNKARAAIAKAKGETA